MTNRERFEAAAADGYFFERDSEGNYEDRGTAAAWDGFSLALANDQRRSVRDLEDAIAGCAAMIETVVNAGGPLAAESATAVDMTKSVVAWCHNESCEPDTINGPLDDAVLIGRKLRENPPKAT